MAAWSSGIAEPRKGRRSRPCSPICPGTTRSRGGWPGSSRRSLFERYCDDIIVHARSERQALQLRAKVAARLAECGLQLNEQKTRIVYCKDEDRRGSYEHTSFTFLGYTFRPRLSKNRFGKHFLNFTPAVSNDAKTAMRREMRRWRLNLRSDKTLTDLARMFNV